MEPLFTHLGSITASDQLTVVYLKKLVAALRSDNIDPTPYLAESGLSEVETNSELQEIPYKDYLKMVDLVLSSEVDPALGFRTGLRFHILDYGMVGYAVISSPTLRKALEALEHYGGDILGGGKVLYEYFRIEGETAIYTIECTLQSPELRQFQLENHAAQFLNGVPQFINQPEFQFQRLSFSFPPPPYADQIEALAPCPVYWDQDFTELHFDIKWLDTELTSTNSLIANFCEEHCKKLSSQLSLQQPYCEKLRRRVRLNPSRIPSIDDLAAQSNVSPRTLRRKFIDEGSSYQQTINEVMMELADQLLTRTSLSVKEIGFRLGYTESANFQRAFRKWFNDTPQNYRKGQCH